MICWFAFDSCYTLSHNLIRDFIYMCMTSFNMLFTLMMIYNCCVNINYYDIVHHTPYISQSYYMTFANHNPNLKIVLKISCHLKTKDNLSHQKMIMIYKMIWSCWIKRETKSKTKINDKINNNVNTKIKCYHSTKTV